MSKRAREYVWEHSRAKGGARLVLLAIAEHINTETEDAWPGDARLAQVTGLTVRQIARIVRKLDADGEVLVEYGRGRGNVHRYRMPYMVAEETGQNVAFQSDNTGQNVTFYQTENLTFPSIKPDISDVKPDISGTPPTPPYKDKRLSTEEAVKTDTARAREAGGEAEQVAELHAHFCAVVKTVPLTPDTKRLFTVRIRERGLDYCRRVCDGVAADDWEDRWKFNNPADVFHDFKRMETFVGYLSRPPTAKVTPLRGRASAYERNKQLIEEERRKRECRIS